MSKKGLTPKQERFIDEYLLDLRGTAAYLRAFPNVKRTTARTEAAPLLANPCVAAEIEAARAEWRERHHAEVEKIFTELAALAFSDIGDVLDLSADGWTVLPARRIPYEARKAVQKATPTKYGVKIEMADKLAALSTLARCWGLFRELPPLETLLMGMDPEMRETIRVAAVELMRRRGEMPPVIPPPPPPGTQAAAQAPVPPPPPPPLPAAPDDDALDALFPDQ